jgi:hypothetical protein
MNAFPWSIFFILLAAGLLGTAAVIPYSLSMNAKNLEKLKENASGQTAAGAKKLPPLPVLILLSGLQGLVLVGLATFLGLLAAGKVGLGLPILQKALEGLAVRDEILAMLPATILLGLASGVMLLGLEWMYFMPRIPRKLAAFDARTAFWKRVLACFYGGVVEEILLRLFLMSVLVWLTGLVWKSPDGSPAAGAFWLANILAALLFGAGHLPATRQITRLTPMVVARALVLNGIPGVAFGYLYMRYGLEAAMLAHFSLDILVHLVAPPISHRRIESLYAEPAAEPA